uniref:USP domain-containing protein n=1 Tax=Arcella intermedia TaxID=1963864 RepID=A0A6B2LBX5_9EUKA
MFYALQTEKSSPHINDLLRCFQLHPYQQGEAMEFFYVLLDSLETSLKKSPLKNLIRDHYTWTFENYLECTYCKGSTSRQENVYAFSLDIEGTSSIEAAFLHYFEPEVLDGDNCFFCQHCCGRRKTFKGVRVVQLPYIATIGIKRFVFNLEDMKTEKLYHKVVFHEIIDMNQFISTGKIYSDDDTEEFSDTPAAMERREQQKRRFLLNGPYVYELYCIVAHQGRVDAGNYSAFIKCLRTKRWLQFDTMVSLATPQLILSTLGGTNQDPSAVCLYYRQLGESPQHNKIPISI